MQPGRLPAEDAFYSVWVGVYNNCLMSHRKYIFLWLFYLNDMFQVKGAERLWIWLVIACLNTCLNLHTSHARVYNFLSTVDDPLGQRVDVQIPTHVTRTLATHSAMLQMAGKNPMSSLLSPCLHLKSLISLSRNMNSPQMLWMDVEGIFLWKRQIWLET